MNQQAFDFNEFMGADEEARKQAEPETSEETTSQNPELDVQKAVVESLAADKAEMDEKLKRSESELNAKDAFLAAQESEIKSLKDEIANLKSSLEAAKARENELSAKLSETEARQFDMQERNPNALALLDRDVELPDRFPGETRDHVLEVIKEAREKAEADGRVRRAQLLESVLVANEPNGNLAKRRAELEKLFADNGNLVNGPVINELERLGIAHKHGEEYLLPKEILNRTY